MIQIQVRVYQWSDSSDCSKLMNDLTHTSLTTIILYHFLKVSLQHLASFLLRVKQSKGNGCYNLVNHSHLFTLSIRQEVSQHLPE